NAGSVFEQRNALARLRAHLRDEVRYRVGRAGKDAVCCVFAIGSGYPRPASVFQTMGFSIYKKSGDFSPLTV
ncbi:hypothetical protein, partial [Pantoea septica]|uniref:hypothetical protein n=1 Tax=Pantoea septica TaxID=472695 RepID=UPI0023F159DA